MFRHRALAIILFVVLAALNSHVMAHADEPQFTTIDIPDAACGTFAVGIDSRGTILVAASNCNSLEGFLLSEGRHSRIDFPDAFSTEVTAINAQRNIVGIYTDFGFGEHGFLLRDGRYTTIVGPNGLDTAPAGINADGDIVGTYFDPQTVTVHAFLLHHGRYTIIDHPDATFTFPRAINAEGDIVGIYVSRSSDGQGRNHHGFLLHRHGEGEGGSDRAGAFTTIDVPGADFTNALGINAEGDIVGLYYSLAHGFFHGFLLRDGRYTTIDDPHAEQSSGGTSANGINSRGEIVGEFTDSAGSTHGFLRSSR